jgi:hypothetical protein
MSSEAHINCWVALLREHRAHQVADVVTGKLDVRPAARQSTAQTQHGQIPGCPNQSKNHGAGLQRARGGREFQRLTLILTVGWTLMRL